MTERLYLEDIFVGRRFAAGPTEVTVEAIRQFAAQFDPQPFHLDEAAAKDSLFGELVASGWHTAALTMRLLTEGAPIAGGLIGANAKIDWLRPVHPGDLLSIEGEVLHVAASRARPERGNVDVGVVTANQRGETVQKMTARILAFARPNG
jgi:acyl dehydratase